MRCGCLDLSVKKADRDPCPHKTDILVGGVRVIYMNIINK